MARTIAQQMSDVVEAATAPYQCALSTRAGTECIAHILQTLTEDNPRTTVLSIDGHWCVRPHLPEVDVGSLDEGGGWSRLHAAFVRLFHGQFSMYLWESDGTVHSHRDWAKGASKGTR